MQHPRLSAADRQRLQLHFDAIRDAEKTMTGMAGDAVDACSSLGLDVTALEALSAYKYDSHRTDEIVRLHMSLVAMAFACNYRRAASLQWGDPYDRTVYDVPSNADRQWKFSFISHRMQSDGAVGQRLRRPARRPGARRDRRRAHEDARGRARPLPGARPRRSAAS